MMFVGKTYKTHRVIALTWDESDWCMMASWNILCVQPSDVEPIYNPNKCLWFVCVCVTCGCEIYGKLFHRQLLYLIKVLTPSFCLPFRQEICIMCSNLTKFCGKYGNDYAITGHSLSGCDKMRMDNWNVWLDPVSM